MAARLNPTVDGPVIRVFDDSRDVVDFVVAAPPPVEDTVPRIV
jgi:hypothetical protein